MLACEGIDPSEATMVGDHAMRDIKGGIDAGLKVIQIDYFNKYEDNNEYPLIREFKKLKDLLQEGFMELKNYIEHTNLNNTATFEDIEILCKEAIIYHF